MRLLDTKTKQAFDAPDSYGQRLIEQGKAVLAPKPAKTEKAEEPKAEEPKKAKAKETKAKE